MEIFKQIPAFPDYEVSNYGRVKTKERLLRYTHAVTKMEFFRKSTERFLKVHSNNLTGYKFYQLYSNKKMYNRPIHNLVANTFLTKGIDHDTVNHKNGNKHDNVVDNLEWCTNAYNHKHASETGLLAKGERIGTSKLTDNSVHAIKWLLNKGLSQSDLGRAFRVSHANISLIANGKVWKHVLLVEGDTLTGEELQIDLKDFVTIK